MKSRFLGGCVVMVVAMLVAGCSAQPADDQAESTATSQPAPSPTEEAPDLIAYDPGAPAATPLSEGEACAELYDDEMEGLGRDVVDLILRTTTETVSSSDIEEVEQAFDDLLYVRNMAPASLAVHLDSALVALSDIHDAAETGGGDVQLDEFRGDMKKVVTTCGGHLFRGTLG